VEEEQVDANRCRLPLLEKQPIGSGAGGKVFRVKVRTGPSTQEELAMKQMNPLEDGEWHVLSSLFEQKLRHYSIARARASFRRDDAVYIFYDLADCNLYEYMKHHRPKEPNGHAERMEMVALIADIAEALRYLHCNLLNPSDSQRFVLYHKDLKAENILVRFRSGKKAFLITDFGFSSIERALDNQRDDSSVSSRPSRSARLLLTKTQLTTDCPNLPPEAHADGSVNALTDIWAYGVVLSEFVPWLYGGWAKLNHFENSRRKHFSTDVSYDAGDPFKPKLRKSISIWYSKLLQEAMEDSDYWLYRDCWELLESHLLVCEVSNRANIETVCEKLRRIRRRNSNASASAGRRSFSNVTDEVADHRPSSMKDRRPAQQPVEIPTFTEPMPIDLHDISRVDTAISSTSLADRTKSARPQSLRNVDTNDSGASPPSMATTSGSAASQDECHTPAVEGLGLHLERLSTMPGMAAVGKQPAQSSATADTRLLKAIELRRQEQAKQLIADDIGLHGKDQHGWNALHYSVALPDTDITSLLLLKRPDLVHERTFDKRQQPLHLCATSANRSALAHATLLLNCRADPNAEDGIMRSALYLAASAPWNPDREAMVTLLLQKGAVLKESQQQPQFRDQFRQLKKGKEQASGSRSRKKR
jgi:serine/threonine protein kinase